LNPFGHIDLRVRSVDEALPFYERLLPELGFTERDVEREWKVFGVPGEEPEAAFFAFIESGSHEPGESRIAFWVSARSEVDRLAEVVRAAGGRDVSGPKEMDYSPGYYAVFFEDPSGNLLEVYTRAGR
jgi:catechol 2,3-dioxygenase-like lactoylglutathione lyase family enzyme